MFEFIQFYRTNKSKLLDILVEILYAFSILLFANELYGKEFNWNSIVTGAKSLSKEFFTDVIGFGLTYFFVAIAAKTIFIFILSIVERSIHYPSYRRLRKKLKKKKKEYSFDQYINDDSLPKLRSMTQTVFLYIKNEKVLELQEYFISSKLSILAIRFVIVLSSFLIVSLEYNNSSFGIIEIFVSIGILLSIVVYYFGSSLERIIRTPGFISEINDKREVYVFRRTLIKNPACHQKVKKREKGSVKEDVFFVQDVSKNPTILAWVVLVDRTLLEKDFIREILENTKKSKGTIKILVDVFDVIPDEFSEQGNLKILKPKDDINLDKEVNSIVLGKYEV